MEAQSLLLGFSSIQNPKNANILAIPTSFSSSSSPYQPPNLVSFKTHNPSLIPQIVTSNKRLNCKSSSIVKAEIGADKVEDLKLGIRRKNLAVFVSGGGSNFRSIHEAILRGSINGDIVVLVASKPGCGGAEYARDKGIPVILFPEMKDKSGGLSPNDLVIALGSAFGGKGYYGVKVHRAVIASGARYSGPTIHFVDEHYDTGRILAQRVVPVLPTDTAEELASRVLHEEHRIYVEVAAALCEERIIWREDGVPLIQSKENPDNYI